MSGQKEDSTKCTFVVIRSLLFAVMLMTFSAASFAQIGISVSFGPPALPVYEQPICPGDGYIWTPGYWAWDGSDYYWVPGTWVEAPEVGFLWTPGYWGWGGNASFSMKVIGARTLDIMAGSITDSGTVVTATKAGGGKTTISTTTPR